MKRIIYYSTLLALILTFTSCGDDFLDRKNLYQLDESSYYSNPQQIKEALTAVYAALPTEHGFSSEVLVAELMSDDRFAGGGPEDIGAQGLDEFKLTKDDLFDNLWAEAYVGIFRANMLILHFDQAEFENQEEHDQLLGEAHFLRAYFYFRLARFFGTCPLIIDPTGEKNVPKAPVDDLFAQIATDLKTAIDIMPAKSYDTFVSGHATKWAAEALMARVYLFYSGTYNKDSMPLNEGGTVSKSNVQDWLVDLIGNSGHKLVSDFRNIWPYSHNKDYTFARDNNLSWVGEDPESGNSETIFAIKYGPLANWGGKLHYANQVPLFMGFRGLNNTPFGKGWGWGTVNPQLWDSFEDGDIRQAGSIINVNNNDEGPEFLNKYKPGGWNAQQETGYWNKKYVPITEKGDDGKWYGMYYLMYGGTANIQLWNLQDQILIRFADVLLMAAELECPNAQQYLDMVRARAGLESVPVTLDNIKKERRHELAFEGLRYHDLMRWHDLESAFSVVKDIPIINAKVPATYNQEYRPETNGFLAIPPSQIRISGGVLEQNPGW